MHMKTIESAIAVICNSGRILVGRDDEWDCCLTHARLGGHRTFGHSLDTKKRKPRSKQVKTGKLWKSG